MSLTHRVRWALAEVYDVLIIGGGPAGLTAGLYASRSRLKALLLEKGLWGGQIVNAEMVENYPGFPEGIAGQELGERMFQQATRYGLETASGQVVGVELGGKIKEVRTGEQTYQARAVVIAAGSEHRHLGAPGERELLGKGISYCAICDGPLFKDLKVAVVGGGDEAVTDALYLTRFAEKVTLIHRRRELRASRILQERALAEPKMDFLWDTVVGGVEGDDRVESLRLRRVDTGERSVLRLDGLFVAIGLVPNTGFLGGALKLDAAGQIITNELMETPIPGVLAAGDIRHFSARQAVAAAGDGAAAALSAIRFLREQG